MTQISVVIPTYNRCASLRETLRTVGGQSFEGGERVEVLVVDNNSRDRTRETVENFQKSCRWPVRYIFEPRQGVSHARNRGINEARGEFLACTDDDVLLDRNWLGTLWRNAESYGAEMVGGKILPAWEAPPPDWLAARHLLGLYGILLRDETEPFFPPVTDWNVLYGPNMGYRRSIFKRIGLYRTDMGPKGRNKWKGDETELLDRAFRAGIKILYTPDAVVYHKVPAANVNMNYLRRTAYVTYVAISQYYDGDRAEVLSWPYFRKSLEAGWQAAIHRLRGEREKWRDSELLFWQRLGRITGALRVSWEKSRA